MQPYVHRRQLVQVLAEPLPGRAGDLHVHPLARGLRVEVGVVPVLREGPQHQADVVIPAELLEVRACGG